MLTIWRRADRYDPARASAATWIFTIARNKHVDRIRRAVRDPVDPRAPEQAPELLPDSQVFARYDAERLRVALAKIPEAQKVILFGTFYEFKTQELIAGELDIPLGTVKSRTRLGLKRLRELLQDP